MRVVALGLVLTWAAGCARPAYVVLDARAGQEVYRARDTLYLRAPNFQYALTFVHAAAVQQYQVRVSAAAAQGQADTQRPAWLNLELDGQSYQLLPGSVAHVSSVAQQGEFTCSGVLTEHCARTPTQQERYTWHFALPAAALARLSHLERGRITLAVRGVALFRDLEPHDSAWIAAFFAAKLSPDD